MLNKMVKEATSLFPFSASLLTLLKNVLWGFFSFGPPLPLALPAVSLALIPTAEVPQGK